MPVKSLFSLRFFYFPRGLGGPLVAAAIGLAACGGRLHAGAGEPPDRPPAVAAPAPLRRLTQEQYRHSVRDLLGVATEGIELPVDEGTAGFFANTIAPVSELQLEQYARAAEVIARAAAPTLARLGACAAPAACDRFIADFGRRAYRRPLAPEERNELAALAARATDPAGGVRLVVQSLLASPNFLYLAEAPLAGSGPVAPLEGFGLAARLSYFLWGSAPDAALLAAAERGDLATRAGLARETQRLMSEPRFRDTLTSFHLQWLDLTELGGVEKRGKLYPLFTPELRTAMREETERFVDHVMRPPPGAPLVPGEDDGRLETLLSGRFSVVGEGLFELYGLGKATGPAAAWRKVELAATRRAGLLTQASFLTQHAHWDKPSLVLRGKVVRERLFCTVLPPPPPDVNNTPPPFDPKVSMRERFEDHRSEVSCARCHRLIDPLGVPFEGFDAIGATRTMDGPVPVDPTSEIAGTAKSDGPVKDAADLMARLARADEVRDCVALQWLRYALGRDVVPADAGSLARLRQVFRDSGYHVPTLIAEIPSTDSFRYTEVVR